MTISHQSWWSRFRALIKSAWHGSCSVGLSVSDEMSCGELRLDLDIDGVLGSLYLSREMWEEIGCQAGWLRPRMTAEHRRQRISFVYGNARISNEHVTRAMVEEVAREIDAAKDTDNQ